MKIFNEMFANQKFATDKKEYVCDERGFMDIDDEKFAQFFLDQGWKKADKIKEDDVEPKTEPKKQAEPEKDEPKSEDEGKNKEAAKPTAKGKEPKAKGGKKPVFSRRSK